FFFSSRRRHTRSKRDWSSDVCSSDLQFYGQSSQKEENLAIVVIVVAPPLCDAHLSNTLSYEWDFFLVTASVFLNVPTDQQVHVYVCICYEFQHASREANV